MKANDNPPPEASLVVELDVYDRGAGDPLVFRVKRMGSRVFTDLVRPNVRSRLAEGHENSFGIALELVLQDTRRVGVTLQLESDLMQRSDAIGGGAIRHKALKDGDAGWFLYNSFAQLMSLNATMIRARVILWLKNGNTPCNSFDLGFFGFYFINGWSTSIQSTQNSRRCRSTCGIPRRIKGKGEVGSEKMPFWEKELCLAQQEAMAEKLGAIEQVKKNSCCSIVGFFIHTGCCG